MEPIEYLSIFRRRWPLVAVTLLLSLVIATFTVLTSSTDRGASYSATATLLSEGEPALDIGTLSRIATSDIVARDAAAALNGTLAADQLLSYVDAAPAPEPGVLTITARSSDPNVAEEVAAVFAGELAELVNAGEVGVALESGESADAPEPAEAKSLRRRIASIRRSIRALEERFVRDVAQAGSQLELQRLQTILSVERAQRERRLTGLRTRLGGDPKEEEGGRTTRLRVIQQPDAEPAAAEAGTPGSVILLVAGGFGLLLGLGVALAVEYFDPRIYDPREVEEQFGFPVLAQIAARAQSRKGPQSQTSGFASIELLASQLCTVMPPEVRNPASDPSRQARVLVVSSIDVTEESSEVVGALAHAFAALGKKVTILATENTSVPAMFGVPPDKPGLAEYIKNDVSIANATHQTPTTHVQVVPSGASLEPTLTLVTSHRTDQLLDELRKDSDVILIQTPPLSAGATASLLIQKGDAALVVAEIGGTTGEAIAEAGGTLKRIDAPVTGMVLRTPRPSPLAKSRLVWQ